MPRSLQPIPADTAITDENGSITTFFRLAWQSLIDSVQFTPTSAASRAGLGGSAVLSAALGTTTLETARAAGSYRVSVYIRKSVADGVSSSLTVTIGWIENGVPLSFTFTPITADSATTGLQGIVWPVWADANTDITLAVSYASNTPGQMKWRYAANVESLT